ncbi:MAG: CCA tRNA nucleotidyltransferase [Brevundimonas sp.]|nr:CCA tRNA nucleotidyltransferase [Brevundimonas sp.]
MDALETEGGPGCARFVGGCVRNSLIGRGADDIDIATRLTPDRVVAAAKAAGLKPVPTGIEHGTVTVVASKRPYEVTTLRRDVETDGRRAVVAFTQDWAEDAARRDFRLNALYADRTGAIFDPTGQGVEDARAGRVVFVGDAETRIREDALRILRFFRFFAHFGHGAPDAQGLDACARLSALVEGLSAERVSAELLKLLAAPDPRPAMRAMDGAGVLGRVLPGQAGLALFEAMCAISDDPALRLSALAPADAEAVGAAAGRLRLSNALRDRLVAAVDDGTVAAAVTAQAARAAVYRLGGRAVLDRLMRREAAGAAPSELAAARAVAADWTAPRLPVGGREVAALGLAPGPETGRLLKAFEDDWIAGDFPADGHAERLKALVSGRGGSR